MRIGAIIQARMSSQRLPGKVLQLVEGAPLLAFLIERLKRCPSIDEYLIATSSEPEDTPLVEFCKRQNIPCFQGNLQNVASRFFEISKNKPWVAFARICGDSPLIHPAVIETALQLFRNEKPDLVTNVHPRSFPIGQSIEVLKTETFLSSFPLMKEAEDLEHVTRYYYQNPKGFNILNFSHQRDHSQFSLAVDTPEDLKLLKILIQRMKKPQDQYSLEELIQMKQEVLKERVEQGH
ncbi:hypothetical protein WDW89_06870 [Deltaproteobacteria bacterium TL4]